MDAQVKVGAELAMSVQFQCIQFTYCPSNVCNFLLVDYPTFCLVCMNNFQKQNLRCSVKTMASETLTPAGSLAPTRIMFFLDCCDEKIQGISIAPS